jgi:integrase
MSFDQKISSRKAGVYHPRPSTGAATDPQTIIDNAPKGTRDWKRVLDAVLRLHNRQHAKVIKVVADKTTLDRERFFFKFWDDLRFNTRFHDADPRYLTNRQVLAVTQLWAQRGLSVATVHNYLSFLRTYAAWIKRPGLVRDVAYYFGEGSHYVRRDRTARADRSWIARSVDVESKLADVRAYDPWVGLQLEICYRFGLRAKEARHFRPHEAVKSRDEAFPRDAVHFPDCERFLRVHRGTKGGRPRDIPLQTPEQIELIDRLLKIVAKGNYVGEPGRTATQNANRFYNTLRRFGITKAALGVTAHGLRHQHTNDRYEELTGEPSPVRGGRSEAANKRTARLAIAHELGHGRLEVCSAYLGQSVVMRSKRSACTDPPAESDGSHCA